MFKERDQSLCAEQAAGGPSAGSAMLSHEQVVVCSVLESRQSLRGRIAGWRDRIESWCDRIDLAPDLAEEIGSHRWFRGLGTMLGLGIAAISFWPDFTAVEAATVMPIGKATRDEFRSQMIMPLGLGGDSGRRMGATAAVVPLSRAPERPSISFTATLAQGDSFGRMLQRAGVGADDAARVSELVSGAVPLADIGAGTAIDLTLGRREAAEKSRPLDKLRFRARFDLDLAIARRGGRLALEQRPIATDATPLRITGRVGSSLYRSAAPPVRR